ncbi:zf-HC2 domain-containing protein [Streptomyces sp. NPDC089799]|uniref:zf-HC2 domain-containing protein n=1 Tax=Streptomyces sp. NPDC089799 TaxID=3155066 RepID=UPI003417EABD
MTGASPSPSPAEAHLGDRLAALVDGELSHDVRERVLAHLATCARCKAEADAQRRLKALFVEAAPPPPPAALLARLQGLPGMPEGPGGSGPPDPFVFALPTAPPASRPRQGFPIHEVGARPRRRFAFVAAGAVSLAAIALGGSLPIETRVEPNARGEGGANVTPAGRPAMTGGVFPMSGGAVVTADMALHGRAPSPATAGPAQATAWSPAARPGPLPPSPTAHPARLGR